MIKTIRKCMALFSKQQGLAQIPLMVALLLMAIAVPAVTKLSQQNQDNRNRASGQLSAPAAIVDHCKIRNTSGICTSWDVGFPQPTQIKAAPTGTVPTGTGAANGKFCLADRDCASGRCDGFSCKATLSVNSGCLFDSDCSSGACTGVVGFKKCTAGSTNIPNGQQCFQNSNCASGRCNLSGKCEALGTTGSGCLFDKECATGKCVGNKCVAATGPTGVGTGACVCVGGRWVGPCTNIGGECKVTNNPVGTGCVSGSDCASGHCVSFKCVAEVKGGCLVDGNCSSGYHCSNLNCVPDKKSGDTCAYDSDCASGNCAGTIGSRKCEAAKGTGSGCMKDSECSSGHCVSFKCVSEVKGGCLTDGNCTSGYHCSNLNCVPDKKTGDTCAYDSDCASGNCTGSPRKCEAAKSTGSGCVKDGECASGFCVSFKCVANVTGGCWKDADCGVGSHCSNLKCVPNKTAGDTCAYDSDCASGNCAGVGTARKCEPAKSTGSGCVKGSECSSGFCVSFKCVASVSGGCFVDGDCSAGSHCSNLKCVPNKATGDTCAYDSDCASGNCSGGTLGFGRKCEPAKTTGSGCVKGSECSSGFCVSFKCVASVSGSCWKDADCTGGTHCSNLKCVPDKATGDSCAYDADCASGKCDGVVGFKKCAPKVAIGGSCVIDNDCTSGQCSFFKCIKGGTIPDNGACTKNSQCASGQCTFERCEGKNGLAEGSRCFWDAQCGPGQTCDKTIFGDDICVKLGNNFPDNAYCTKNSQCASGQCTFERCEGKNGLPEGARCFWDAQCGPGKTCDKTIFGDDICVKVGTGLADNSACTKDSQCKSGKCTFEKCQGAAGLPEGAKCSLDSQCGTGLTCDKTIFGDDICVKTGPGKTANGGSCFWDTDCSSGHCTGFYPNRSCSPTEGNLPNGSSCTVDGVCASGVCSGTMASRKCVAKASNGSTCVYDFECASGICAGTPTFRRCEATKDNRPNGSACVWDSDCASHDCRDLGYVGKQCVGGPGVTVTVAPGCKASGMVVSDAGQCCSKSASYNNAQLTCAGTSSTPTIGPSSCKPACTAGWTCLAGADGKPVCAVEGQDSCKPGDVVTQASHGLGCGAATRICKCVSNKNWSCFCDTDGNGAPGCGDNLKGAKTTRPDGSTLWLHLDDETSAKCLCGDKYHQNNNGKYFCGSGDGGNGGGGNGGGGNATPTSGGGGGTTPTTATGSCKECAKDFKCYHKGGEYKWFVTGYVMDGFTAVEPGSVEEPCANVPKPNFLGKTKGDANCDGSIDVTDYSLWHKEFFDGDKGSVAKDDWNADFTGSNGKCDGKVDVYDFSLWQKFFSEFKNEN